MKAFFCDVLCKLHNSDKRTDVLSFGLSLICHYGKDCWFLKAFVCSLRRAEKEQPVCPMKKDGKNWQEKTNDRVAASEALFLIQNMEQFEFIVTMVLGMIYMFQVNMASKAIMQSETMNLPNASQLLKNCSEFVKECRVYSSALITAREIASQAGIDSIFKSVRFRRKKRLFQYEAVDETPTDSEELFEINVFYLIIDTIENALVTQFTQLSKFNDAWSFLYNIKRISEKSKLEKACADLEISLTDGEKYDISDGCELVKELIHLNQLLKEFESAEPLKVLQVILKNGWQDILPNMWTELRILLTIPVTVAKGERSFSKLKLIYVQPCVRTDCQI
ncbi:hypothetical protein RI129_011862 [Pyrocoelia pectoralis]|uniref:HAT C-terminal dimerisation domain-containing protein n=1 Tax=Pyrocoelia pectoralis TaxID=417401 RepID=A0AAN7UXJ4_9COLE